MTAFNAVTTTSRPLPKSTSWSTIIVRAKPR